jgi:hypothetical protein
MPTEDQKKAEFIEFYQQLCEEYGMCIEANQGPSSMGDIELSVDDFRTPKDLDIHIRELKDHS